MSKKILIVDDAVFHRLKCSNLLKEQGYRILEASDGMEAIRQFKEKSPDLVLMDITMPELDGISALKKIMEISPFANVVMFTAQGQQALISQALSLGAKDYLLKPTSNEKLLALVTRILGEP
ncbi:MAG: response regulator [Armatimonadetes bacterium]|nr:response regulator [Armatimonadota bacterium]